MFLVQDINKCTLVCDFEVVVAHLSKMGSVTILVFSVEREPLSGPPSAGTSLVFRVSASDSTMSTFAVGPNPKIDIVTTVELPKQPRRNTREEQSTFSLQSQSIINMYHVTSTSTQYIQVHVPVPY